MSGVTRMKLGETVAAVLVCVFLLFNGYVEGWIIPTWQVAREAPSRRDQHRRDVNSVKKQLRELIDTKREMSEGQAESPKEEFKRIVNSRVSFKVCNMDDGLKQDCGFFGMDDDDCYKRGCCWGSSKTEGVPWCYHSTTSLKPECSVVGTERNGCGFFGIRRDQCMAMGCCWKPSNENHVPWCYHIKRVPVFDGECGVPNIPPAVISSIGRIVAGDEAKEHSWPWMVSLESDEHFCGGSLINDQWVLTAAHCEPGYEWGSGGRKVVIGMHSQLYGSEHQRVIDVEDVIPHEYYDDSTYDNDIMLLKLAEKVTFGEHVEPVCLPDLNQRVAVGTHCYSTGWGHTEFGGESPDTLQQVVLPILSEETCNKKSWYDGKITDNMLCAGYEEGGRDSCQGDSGGPLVCYTDDHYVLYGVVSWGEGCASQEKPGLYARVSNFVDWIEQTIAENR